MQYPSLENGTLGSVPDGWNMNGAGTFVKSADVAHYGSYSGKLTVSNQQGFPTHSLASTINLANAYTVSAWVDRVIHGRHAAIVRPAHRHICGGDGRKC